MSAIDIQNAKQIRDPMDVLITLSLGTDIAMTYSGYSSAKVADGVLNQSSWPMRGLADLQGDGFPLDGSRVLYNPSTSPSQTNGKLGVRGNVGQPVSVTATGNDTIAALAISVTGAASVTLNGETTEITGSHVTLQLLNTTATLTFQPSSEDRRVEIITVLPEADFVINNDNLIKATVSLRSDLSIIDPTLPESELNVEVYQDLDISEAVASIPEDTPITYQAGYPGDMSPVRKFYVSGQVTWEDNVLKIQAVDAVHFLEEYIVNDMHMGEGVTSFRNNTLYPSYVLGILLGQAGIDFIREGAYYVGDEFYEGQNNTLVISQQPLRSVVAWFMNYFHVAFPAYTLPDGSDEYWPTYVDAGRPLLRISKPAPIARIDEADCGSYKYFVERKIKEITLSNRVLEVSRTGTGAINFQSECGSVSWVKGTGFFPKFDDFVMQTNPIYRYGQGYFDRVPLNPTYTPDDGYATVYGSVGIRNVLPYGAEYFVTNQWPNGTYGPGTRKYYTQVAPWSANQADNWARYVEGENTASVDGELIGIKAADTLTEKKYTAETQAEGLSVRLEDMQIFGRFCNGKGTEMFPNLSIKSLLKRSNITCSFTWKGDPRIQPRDVFTFHRLDGTDEEWTFENITITHEGGGTLAEVTARKGIV